MAVLMDIRNLLRRKKDHASLNGEVTRSESDRSSLATVEPKVNVSTPAPKGRSLSELQRGHEEVMGLVRKIGDHLDDQSQRHRTLDEVMGQVPAALEVLPDINRQNARLLELLVDYLDQGKQRDRSLSDTLERVSDSSRQQSEVMGLVQQHLDAHNHSTRQVAETLGEFRQTMTDLGESNSRAVEVLDRMGRSAEARDARMEMVLRRTQTWMIVVAACCGLAAITALVVGLL
ncbi:MAG: hypothetical protein ACYTGC_07600 [Planctomycetota bacterium]|jgi:hypothetical protein